MSVNPEAGILRLTIWWRYNSIGYMLKEGLVGAETVYNFIGPASIQQWDKWGPNIKEQEERGEMAWHGIYEGFEYLAKEMEKVRDRRVIAYKK